MSTLKVNKLRDTAGSADAITLDPNGGAVLAGVTTMTTARVTSGIVTNTFIVGAGVTISESGIEASGIGITCANINGAQIGGRRNLIINGAMMVAQRGTSSTSSGYYTVDRMSITWSGVNENPTVAQVDVSSGTTPHTLGFRKSVKITNGNQTGGAGSSDYVQFLQRIEAQNVANSGWNYYSASSFITLSFWIKSSVAQAFSGSLRAPDGTSQSFKFDTPSLSADTWTKVVKTIPGNSNITVANDTGVGLDVYLFPFLGTSYTDGSSDTETWVTAQSGNYSNDMTTTWYTTNDATWEITGLQLEVGPQATPFEHRPFGEELHLCHRYFYSMGGGTTSTMIAMGIKGGTTSARYFIKYPNTMRATPTFTINDLKVDSETTGSYQSITSISDTLGNEKSCRLVLACDSSASQGSPCSLLSGGTSSYLRGSAEL